MGCGSSSEIPANAPVAEPAAEEVKAPEGLPLATEADSDDRQVPTPATQDEEFKANLAKGIAAFKEYSGDVPAEITAVVVATPEELKALSDLDRAGLRADKSAEDLKALDEELKAVVDKAEEDNKEIVKDLIAVLTKGADPSYVIEEFMGPGSRVPLLSFVAMNARWELVAPLLAAGGNPHIKQMMLNGEEKMWMWSGKEQSENFIAQIAEEPEVPCQAQYGVWKSYQAFHA